MDEQKETIELEHGGGGQKSWELIQMIRRVLNFKGKWTNTGDDGAALDLKKWGKIIFTTDSFIVDPLFFPGGDIGKIAMCGTINDLAVMGARPLGIGLSLVIEEGFSKSDLVKILQSINVVSRQVGVPIVTGDTKVTERGKIDKIEITTSGIGLADKIINNGGAKRGDYIISSGDLGEHTVALLSSRFNYKSRIKSDSKPLDKELSAVGKYLNACKDPTRGGLAANIVEIADKSKVKIILDEKALPFKKETIAISELLGIDVMSFASEGRFIAAVPSKNVKKVLAMLKKYNKEAKAIGRVERGKGVFLMTRLGSLKPIEMPRGKLVPRIC
ncbi:hydrogenase expression/formation protein HypE [Patescibacteria group bacterium]|nr:MAG: hydrogenase expression/formation protein HypE [Patescibacteria group bacterium]